VKTKKKEIEYSKDKKVAIVAYSSKSCNQAPHFVIG
jgi:hypothetical protein